MLTLSTDDKQNTCFMFIGSDAAPKATHLISNNTSLISTTPADGGVDTCSFYSGPSDAAIVAFGEACETSGSIAYSGAESCGSIAYAGGGGAVFPGPPLPFESSHPDRPAFGSQRSENNRSSQIPGAFGLPMWK